MSTNATTNNRREEYHPEIGVMFESLYNDTDLLREIGAKHPEAKEDCDRIAEGMCRHLASLYRRLREL